MQTVEAADYHELAQVFDPQVAPDGERVAFVRRQPESDEEYDDTIYVARIGGDWSRFTAADGVDSQPRWSPSGDRLAFVSTRGGDDDSPQLWVLPADGGEARQVTNVVGGVASPAWSPDGERIAFVQSATAAEREAGHDLDVDDEYERETSDPRVIDRTVYRADERYFDGARGHVYVADLADDSVERLTDGDHDHASPSWVDGETLYYAVRRTDDPDDNIRYDVDAHDLATGDATTLVETTGTPAIDAASDGRVAYAYGPEERLTLRQTEIEVYDPATDETVWLTADFDRTIGLQVCHKPTVFEWDPAEAYVYFTAPDRGTYPVWRAPGDASADPQAVSTGRHVHGFSVGDDVVAVTASEWDHPGDLFVSTPAGAEESRLTRVNREYLDERAVAQPEEISFESDGHEIQGWVLTPPEFDPEERYPLSVEIHGGPHAMWSTAGTMWHEFQTMAARGYVVFWSNPRGSSGYGEAHMAAIERDWGDVTMADVMAGVEAVAARDYVDETNAFVSGGSFGGYMTAWIVGHTDYFKGAVAQRGVYDLPGFYGTTDGAFKLVEGDFGTVPWEESELLWAQSPAAHAHGATTPTLVIHSENDYRVPISDGELLFRVLRKNGVESRFVRYPDEGHELSRSGQPGHVVDRIERVVRWFNGYSAHHDVPKAIERGDDGLSAREETDDDADE